MVHSLDSAEIISACAEADDGSDRAYLNCVTEQLLLQDERDREFSRTIYLIYSAALVFFMQAGFAMLCAGAVRKKNVRILLFLGFAMLCAGAVRKKNVQNTMLKNLLDACGASIAFYAFGYAFAFGDGSNPNAFVGTTNFFLKNVDDLAFWMFQYAFSAASATIVAGTLAERCQMAAYLCYSLVLAGFVYPVIVHSIWSPHGFLSPLRSKPFFDVGVVDFAGGGVVHLTGGTTALFATMILGPRRGRFHDEEGRKLEKPKEFPGHSIALQMLGTLTLWFGWYGFNAGSALITDSEERDALTALAAVNTTLAGGMAGMCALFTNFIWLERRTGEPIFDLKMAMNGSLAGLVAITAGAGVVDSWAAVVIGAVAGLLYLLGTHFLVLLRLDDAVDAIPVHMFNGMWGMIAVGLFASRSRLELTYAVEPEHIGFFESFGSGGADARLLVANTVGALWIISWVCAIMLPFFVWLDWKGWFRSDPLEEIVGLDTSYHGGLILSTGDESVNPEYISQFRKQREQRRSSRSGPFSSYEEEDGGDVAMTDVEDLS